MSTISINKIFIINDSDSYCRMFGTFHIAILPEIGGVFKALRECQMLLCRSVADSFATFLYRAIFGFIVVIFDLWVKFFGLSPYQLI